jgi:cobalt/nickel transport system permease protein
LHHVVLERWSQGNSPFHRLDARAKTGALLVLLTLIATSRVHLPEIGAAYFVLLAGSLAWARLPLRAALWRSMAVLPFSLIFGGISWLAGDAARAVSLVIKSYLSALAVLLLISTTPMPQLLRGLESMGVPRFLLMVTQFMYRYLFVISEEAQHMRAAAAARGFTVRGANVRFRPAAGALAVLFARSYEHAQDIHRAMVARGFHGRFELLYRSRFRWQDGLFLAAAITLPAALRFAFERVAK